MAIKIYTIVVNWNLREDTLVCLRSLFTAGAAPGSVIIVDNASEDGSVGAIRIEFGDEVRLIETGENLGLAGGINSGLPVAMDAGAEWVFLLNNDTVVEPDLFDRFDEARRADPGVSVWGPRIIYFSDPGRVWFLAERRFLWTLLSRPVRETALPEGVAPIVVPADFISGCAMLVRRDVFERVGGFDKSLFLFAEEVDFCLRASRAGFRLAAAPRVGVRHKVSLSTEKDKPKSRFLRIRNQIRVYRRYSSRLGVIFYFGFTTLRTAKLVLRDIIRGDPSLAGSSVRGWLTGWFK